MNTEESKNQGNVEGEGGKGTTFASLEEAEKGYLNLKALHDAQANELGSLRKNAQTMAEILKEKLMSEKQGNAVDSQKGTAPAAPDYDAELSDVQKSIQELDPMADNYQKELAALVSKSNKLTAMSQHEKTLSMAREETQRILSERDSRSAQQKFYDDNPSFNTPEVQARIKDFIANDKTGLHDPMSAFFQLQRDDISAQAEAMAKENAEYKRRLGLAKGAESVGKVVVKGQSPAQQQTQNRKQTDREIDEGMRERLRSL